MRLERLDPRLFWGGQKAGSPKPSLVPVSIATFEEGRCMRRRWRRSFLMPVRAVRGNGVDRMQRLDAWNEVKRRHCFPTNSISCEPPGEGGRWSAPTQGGQPRERVSVVHSTTPNLAAFYYETYARSIPGAVPHVGLRFL